jgi:hypothetical protein
VQQLPSAGLAVSSIWEEARARNRQREVAGDKGQWDFVLQGMRPAVAQAAEWWQGTVLIRQTSRLSVVSGVHNRQTSQDYLWWWQYWCGLAQCPYICGSFVCFLWY